MAKFDVTVSSRSQASEECREALQCTVDIAGQNGAQFELCREALQIGLQNGAQFELARSPAPPIVAAESRDGTRGPDSGLSPLAS
jgi:hypothetical protein